MARLTPAQWLGRLRAKGWTRPQITAATGASASTQLRITRGGHSPTYDTAITTVGRENARRTKVPEEYRDVQGQSLATILRALAKANLEPDDYTLDALKEQFGAAGRRAILAGQLKAHNRTKRGQPANWYYHHGPELMRKYSRDGELVDPFIYREQLWYVGRMRD